jgi:DDE family transposase
MAESIAAMPLRRGTPHASLAVLGVKLCQLDLLAPIRKGVQIAQKRVKYSPFEKLYDCFIGILAGAHGIVEINERLRADPALQTAFGRTACAEQSVVQDTLNACTAANVAEMDAAMTQIYRQQSRAAHHDFAHGELLLDADMSGLPCGKKAALATKGYFEGTKNRRGRQLGRVLATDAAEIVVDQLYPGNVQLVTALPEIVERAEQRLALTAAQRAGTILRVDAGGGSVGDINWALERGYLVHAKDCSSQRAQKLAESVRCWYADPKVPGREVGVVTAATTEYVQPVRRVAVRCRMANGQWKAAALISTVPVVTVLARSGQSPERSADLEATVLADVYFYDQRGGGVETSLKGDKQGLGMNRRNKKRFEAQQMLVQLNALAHNVLVWGRGWMEPAAPLVRRYGIERLVRDLFAISGAVETDRSGRVCRIVINQASHLAQCCLAAFQLLLPASLVAVNLGQT